MGHAEVQIGDSVVMMVDANETYPATPGNLHLYVEDCDAVYARALEAGAESVQEMADPFYGDRSGGVRDPGGNVWWITTHVEDVDPAEMGRRARSGRRSRQGEPRRHYCMPAAQPSSAATPRMLGRPRLSWIT